MWIPLTSFLPETAECFFLCDSRRAVVKISKRGETQTGTRLAPRKPGLELYDDLRERAGFDTWDYRLSLQG